MNSVKGPIWNRASSSAPPVGHQVTHRVSGPIWRKMYIPVLETLNDVWASLKQDITSGS